MKIPLFSHFIFIATILVCCSCGSTKVVTQAVERTSVDTVYLSNIQYDSIFVSVDHSQEYHLNHLNSLKPYETDTLFIKDVSVEYRYKMLRDTIYKVQSDSIPYEVRITEVKEIQRPLTFFDRLCRSCFFLLLGAILLTLYRFTRKYFRI